MKTLLVSSFVFLGFAGGIAGAGVPDFNPQRPGTSSVPVQADCYAVGEDKAAEMGGTLAKATPAKEAGQPVCKVVVVVPGKEGERPKRVEIVVPQ